MNRFLAIFCWVIIIGVSGIGSRVWAQGEFDRLYRDIFELERQLFAFDPKPDYETRSSGDIGAFLNFYYEDLVKIKTSVRNHGTLDPLEKFCLQVYADGVMAGQVWSLLSRLEPSEENQKRYLNSRLEILRFIRTNPEEDFQVENEAMISWVKGLYSETLFDLAGLDPGGTIAYVSALEREGYEALRIHPYNIRALLALAIYHTTIGNLDVVNLEKAQRYLNQAFALLEEGNSEMLPSFPPGSLNFFRALTWAWQSQNDLARLDRQAALTSIDRALAIYPRSGFLNYLKTLISANRLMTQGDGGVIDDPSKINFSYEYSIVSEDRFLYQNYFNFAFNDTILSPYVAIGNNFIPFGLYLEVGGRLKWGNLSGHLIFKHKNSFSKNLSEHYSGEFNLGWADRGWRINLRSDIGQIWEYRRDEGEETISYDGVVGVEEALTISYLILNHPQIDIDSKVRGRYFYAWDLSQGLWDGNFSLQLNTLKFGWGQLELKSGVHLAGKTTGGELFNRLSFFSESPFPVVGMTRPFEFPQTDLVGDWLASTSFTYRVYPFYALNTHNAVKSIFMAPSFFLGWIGDQIGESKSQFSYSALGNIGFTFPGGTSIAVGFGWNEREEWVINLLSY